MSHFDVLDFGAVGDGETNDRAAIQKAIDTCTANGGGQVRLAAGKQFLSGQIVLKDHVDLHLEPGARLIASTDPADYDDRVFVSAFNAFNVSVTGTGVIDGRGHLFMREELPHIYDLDRDNDFRTRLVKFTACRNVTFRDVTLFNGASWTLHLAGCDDVLVHGIRILNNLKLPNCDGIGPDRSRNVRISDCYIEAGDDCIVLKATQPHMDLGPCENITVTGCTLVSASAALKIGTETYGDIRNVIFDSCVIRGSNRGLAIMLRDNGNLENILFSNCIVETHLYHDDWWGKAEPIHITVSPRTETTQLGTLKHVRFNNILCRGESGVYINGCKDRPVEDVLLENVRLEIEKTTEWPAGFYDNRPGVGTDVYPHPTAGVFLQHARDVTLRHTRLAWGENPLETYRYAVEAHHVDGLTIEDFNGFSADPEKYDAFLLDDTSEVKHV